MVDMSGKFLAFVNGNFASPESQFSQDADKADWSNAIAKVKDGIKSGAIKVDDTPDMNHDGKVNLEEKAAYHFSKSMMQHVELTSSLDPKGSNNSVISYIKIAADGSGAEKFDINPIVHEVNPYYAPLPEKSGYSDKTILETAKLLLKAEIGGGESSDSEFKNSIKNDPGVIHSMTVYR